MKLKPYQRKMLKKMLKGTKKGALPFDVTSGLTQTNLGSLWAPGMKLNNVTGGGKSVMILDMTGESAIDAGTRIHNQILEDIDSGKAYRVCPPTTRDWSLEPTMKKGVITFNDKLLGEGFIEPEAVYTMPAPGSSRWPALHLQQCGRIIRNTPTGAGPDFDANIQGPTIADLIEQGYLQPLPQDVRIDADSLFSKFGFGDGDLLDDLLLDNGYDPDLGEVWDKYGKTKLGLSQRLLVKLVDTFLLPSLPIKLEPKVCLGIHNPYRCATAIAHGESTTPHDLEVRAVTVPNATVLEMAEAMKLEILGEQA